MKENPGSISNPSVHHKYFEQLRKVLSIEFPLKKAPSQSVRKKWRPPSQLSGQKSHKEAIFILQRGPHLRKSATLQRCGILHCTLSRKTTRHHHNHLFIELLWRRKTSTSEKFHLRRIVQENPFVQFEIHVRLWTRNVSMKLTGLKSLM